ncbi:MULTISPECIES: ECF transporter S component [unclassified Streptomyces]|uniref:ECF transporter S component n=1 Tax=unclassified Streptomyces TaxID=2593676 RepID=UPI0022B6702F|nr:MULTISPECIES: ECF transporter S component [unclassified Streptomyces]MCZ7414038.1 ECF transporter S component [Streptomyces sp. WMMC897]MCZ7431034.1 ECF transporter S component [Streptomyces sp. WMMC1477]
MSGAHRDRPVRLGPRAAAALALVSATGLVAFGWPLLADSASGLAHSADAPWLFAALLPLLLAVVVATIADSGMDAKAVAMLGVLAAAGAALRPLGAGTAGLEPMFFLMILSGRVLGPGFGFVLGALAMFAGALLTGGVGPWLPFQMLTLGWVTMGAGLLPRPHTLRGRGELWLLAVYGAPAAMAYGLVMNLQGWPYIGGLSTGISFVPGDPAAENLARFTAYWLATSLGWDVPRAALTAVLTLAVGGPVLRTLRRATRRAAFAAPVTFASGTADAVRERGDVPGPADAVGPAGAERPDAERPDAGRSADAGPAPGAVGRVSGRPHPGR